MMSSAGGSGHVLDEGLFCKDWSARDELRLLEAVEEFGYGNWLSVAEKMGRTVEDCRPHYDHYYLHHDHSCLSRGGGMEREPCPPLGAISNDRDCPIPPYYSGQEIGCYMPHRGDFAVEPMNDAEKLLTDLDLEPDDDDDELFTALKLAVVKMYCQKLKQRAFRKWMVREYGLLDIRKQATTDKIKLMKNQLAIKRQLRPFMRFMSPQSAQKLLQSLYLADELREEIQRLQEYRANGITTQQGAELCERLQRRRRQQKTEQGEVLRNSCTVEESLFLQLVTKKPEEKRNGKTGKDKQIFEISRLSGVERLTPDERELCLQCRLHPEALLQYMVQLEGEWQRFGRLRLADARKLLKIDVNKTRRIFNFLVRKGRIR